MTRFAIATREELWSQGRLLERRLSHGEAIDTDEGIVATDARDEALVAECDRLIEQLRRCLLPDVRMRLVAEASSQGTTQTITVTQNGLSIVTSPDHIEEDMSLLRSAGVPPAGPAPSRRLPILWKHGTAAVLLHEAYGHPLEHGHEPVPWPEWLRMDAPLKQRRASFRDLPLLRMTTLTAHQTNAPFELPDERIEVLLIDGGYYEPLTEVVTLRIAAATIDGIRIGPFSLERTRAEIARSITGARGEPIRYPGVICSREGQQLAVASHAPELLTVFA